MPPSLRGLPRLPDFSQSPPPAAQSWLHIKLPWESFPKKNKAQISLAEIKPESLGLGPKHLHVFNQW